MHVRREGVMASRVGEDVMLLDLDASTYYAVGGSGTLVLDVLRSEEGADSVDELVDAVLAAHDDARRPDVERDVAQFLDRLRQAGLLHG